MTYWKMGLPRAHTLTGEDSYHEHDQGKPSVRLIEELLASGTGPDGNLTPADLSQFSAKRRAEAKNINPQFSLPFNGKLFGSSKCVLSSGLFRLALNASCVAAPLRC